jgi:hypothetical protein
MENMSIMAKALCDVTEVEGMEVVSEYDISDDQGSSAS